MASHAGSRRSNVKCRCVAGRPPRCRSDRARNESPMSLLTMQSPSRQDAKETTHSVSLVCYGYNEAESIAEFFDKAVDLLESVTSDYEIVFIDDCSTDGTWEIAERFAR